MLVKLLAAGTRLPDWMNAGVAEYARRFTSELKFELKEIPLGKRSASSDTRRAMAEEGERMLAAVSSDTFVVTLEVTGKAMSTEQLAEWLKARLQSGQDLALMIGGPEGLSPECVKRSNLRWSLSALTLPHGIARVMVVEQLYRALSVIKGHPYHRA